VRPAPPRLFGRPELADGALVLRPELLLQCRRTPTLKEKQRTHRDHHDDEHQKKYCRRIHPLLLAL